MELLTLLCLGVLAETMYLTYRTTKQPLTTSKHTQSVVCDTSILIDGRILAIARSGFLSSNLIIPKCVVRELQWMADKADHDKRERARYGLDMVAQLQALTDIEVTIYDDGATHPDGVDEQLLIIAKKLQAKLCTTDYNLNKVARTESIPVVNVNELAHALRPLHLPGEMIQVTIVTPGQNKDQGVGYLDDGTMVVVDGARKHIGKNIQVETVRLLQTEAGRMVFAKAKQEHVIKHEPKRPAEATQASTQSSRHHRAKRVTAEDNLISIANRLGK